MSACARGEPQGGIQNKEEVKRVPVDTSGYLGTERSRRVPERGERLTSQGAEEKKLVR